MMTLFKFYWKTALIFLCFVFLRVSSVFFVKTFFVPDEYWQSLEVAHNAAYGYGYLTWEWDKKIRSSIYPAFFYILYKIFPDCLFTTVVIPRIFQAILSACGDLATYKFSCKVFGHSSGKWTFFNLVTSWFLYYSSSRTLTNMSETSFTACGLYFYSWAEGSHKRLPCSYLWFAGLSTLMRPTAVVFWFPLYIYHSYREKDHVYIVKNTVIIVSTILTTLLVCDRWFYGEWVFSVYNFYVFNWKNDIGAFYGEHPFLWYFTEGLPSALFIQLIPFLLGIRIEKLTRFYCIILAVLLVFSIPSHKEVRFLLPLAPLCLVLCGETMNVISRGRYVIFDRKMPPPLNTAITCLILAAHVPLTIYLSQFHQRGSVDVLQALAERVDGNSSVAFLMPCHSTPYYSHLHKNITMRFLTCEPNFSNAQNYEEEALVFHLNPEKWLHKTFTGATPSHLVFYDSLTERIGGFLKTHGYEQCFHTFHSHYDVKRTSEFVQIYCKSLSEP